MDFALKYHKEILILVILIALYFLLRLPNLTLQPIFADEAIYIRWAQIMRAEPTLRFLPVSDGKTPLFMWVLMPVLKFVEDPLLAGRLLSVFSGFFTLLGVYLLTRSVFSQKAAFWASFLYAIIPYTVFFDRMALVDSMLSAFTIWALYFAIWLSKSVRLDLAFILGYILGGAWLTKTPAFLNLFLLPFTLLVFKGSKDKRLLKLLLFWTVSIITALIMYNMLRLGPQFHLLSSRNSDYIFSPLELVGRPLDPFIPHLRDISDWFPKLLTWPVLGFMVYGLWFMVKAKNRMGGVVLLWAIIPLLIEMAFLRTFTARYLLPSIPPLLIFAGLGMERISNKFLMPIFLIVLVIPSFNFNYRLLTNPPPDSLPKEERKGYFEDWTAGYGFFEIAQFLKEQRKEGKVVVGTEGFFGTLPDGLHIYLDRDDITVLGSTATISAQIRGAAKDNKTFFVGNKKTFKTGLAGVELIKEYQKAKPKDGDADATVLFRVLP